MPSHPPNPLFHRPPEGLIQHLLNRITGHQTQDDNMSKHDPTPIPDQNAKLNQGTPAIPDPHHDPTKDDASNALAQFLEWQGNVLARLGLDKLTGNVKADNAILTASLATIAATGAPVPVIVTETISYPGNPPSAFTVDVYEFSDFGKPTVRSTEYLLAANPQIVINELRAAGQIE